MREKAPQALIYVAGSLLSDDVQDGPEVGCEAGEVR